MVLYLARKPRGLLGDFVESLWLCEVSDAPHLKERVLPQGSMELLFNLHEDSFQLYDQQGQERFQSFCGSLLTGVYTRHTIIDTHSQKSIIGVHFKAGGVSPFLKFPAGEVQDTDLSLHELWGDEVREVRGRLCQAETPEIKFYLLEQFLYRRMVHPLKRHPAVAFALKEFQRGPDALSVGEVVERIGVSQRHFVQLFSEEVGLTPKLFLRIQRFQEVLSQINADQHPAGPRSRCVVGIMIRRILITIFGRLRASIHRLI